MEWVILIEKWTVWYKIQINKIKIQIILLCFDTKRWFLSEIISLLSKPGRFLIKNQIIIYGIGFIVNSMSAYRNITNEVL